MLSLYEKCRLGSFARRPEFELPGPKARGSSTAWPSSAKLDAVARSATAGRSAAEAERRSREQSIRAHQFHEFVPELSAKIIKMFTDLGDDHRKVRNMQCISFRERIPLRLLEDVGCEVARQSNGHVARD